MGVVGTWVPLTISALLRQGSANGKCQGIGFNTQQVVRIWIDQNWYSNEHALLCCTPDKRVILLCQLSKGLRDTSELRDEPSVEVCHA